MERTHAASASQTASKRKPDSFGPAAIYCKKSNRTADISISRPIWIPTSLWHKFEAGATKMEKASNKPTTFTATKSVSHVK